MADRTIRALSNIRNSASSARVLDLVSVQRQAGHDPRYRESPFFRNPILNKSIILKHRLRADETGLFSPRRFVATKIIVPVDGDALRYGGRSVFVGQQHYDALMRDSFGEDVRHGSLDRLTLEALDELPSLDPFILREHLSRRDIRPASCYFDVSQADVGRMFDYVRADVAPLVEMCFGTSGEFGAQTKKLVGKILSSDLDNELEPLRETLRLERAEYNDGVFCWKGFLYYKWLVNDLFPEAVVVSREIKAMRPTGQIGEAQREQIKDSKERLGQDVLRVCQDIRRALDVYDRAFDTLTGKGDPTAFREFLLTSPKMFFDLGANFAAIQHIVSFWRYRTPDPVRGAMEAGELADMLLDFESGVPRETLERREASIRQAAPTEAPAKRHAPNAPIVV